MSECNNCTNTGCTKHGKGESVELSCDLKTLEPSEERRLNLAATVDAINHALAADGITEIVAVPVATLLTIDQLRKEHAEMKARLEGLEK